MPVRKLKPSYIANTGRYPSDKKGSTAQYESFLERNFIAILDNDPTVISIDEHPFTTNWIDSCGIERPYTPDMLVVYDHGGRPVVFEVKSRKEIRDNFDFLKYKYRALKPIIRSKGYQFRLITESDLTGAYVDNLLFLKKYRLVEIEDDFLVEVKEFLQSGPRSVDDYLDAYAQTIEEQIYLLPMIWAGVAKKELFVDFHRKFTNSTLLYGCPLTEV